MMIVVPTFSQRDQRHEQIIPTVVLSREASLSKNVRERIDRERAVVEHNRADEKGPNQHLKSVRSGGGRTSLKD